MSKEKDFLSKIATEIGWPENQITYKVFMAAFSFSDENISMKQIAEKVWQTDGEDIRRRIKTQLTQIYQKLSAKYKVEFPDRKRYEAFYKWLWEKYIADGGSHEIQSQSHFLPCEAELQRALEILSMNSGFVSNFGVSCDL